MDVMQILALAGATIVIILLSIRSYVSGWDDGHFSAIKFQHDCLRGHTWLYVNGRFYRYDVPDEVVRDLMVTDIIHGGGFGKDLGK